MLHYEDQTSFWRSASKLSLMAIACTLVSMSSARAENFWTPVAGGAMDIGAGGPCSLDHRHTSVSNGSKFCHLSQGPNVGPVGSDLWCGCSHYR